MTFRALLSDIKTLSERQRALGFLPVDHLIFDQASLEVCIVPINALAPRLKQLRKPLLGTVDWVRHKENRIFVTAWTSAICNVERENGGQSNASARQLHLFKSTHLQVPLRVKQFGAFALIIHHPFGDFSIKHSEFTEGVQVCDRDSGHCI